jgi:hypothetical protein
MREGGMERETERDGDGDMTFPWESRADHLKKTIRWEMMLRVQNYDYCIDVSVFHNKWTSP